MTVHLLVLNYNGRDLLAECLPSVVEAAERAQVPCRVSVLDNDSRDDSLAWLAAEHPEVPVFRQPNRGLCSFNRVLAALDDPVAILLNNDIKLAPDCLDPLVAPLLGPGDNRCFLTAPRCWQFDGSTYEGFKSAIGWRYGLVQATSFFPGHERVREIPDETACTGAVMAVQRERFLALGGFDPIFLPGRIEDLDFAFRGYQAGWHARYVPEAVAYHLGCASFGKAFGDQGNRDLALRNTLLFQWLNLRHPLHLVNQATWLPIRALADLLCAPLRPAARRLEFWRACCSALKRYLNPPPDSLPRKHEISAERAYFRRLSAARLSAVRPTASSAPARPSLTGPTKSTLTRGEVR